MDPTARFFTALRKMAVTLESETEKLQHAFKNRDNDDEGDGDATAKATRAFHEVNCDVGVLKGQIQGQIAQQRAQENEVTGFLKACRVMEQRVAKDIQALKGHWEKYGYQAPRETRGPSKAEDDEASEAEDEAADESETKSTSGDEENREEDRGPPSSPPPGPPPFIDMLRTPQLSDFGLSEVEMKRALAGAGWYTQVPPLPVLSLPQPSLSTPTPLTPKCTLRMDDDELQTHQMPNFGLSENTMCLNNDFTMDLYRKNNGKPQRPPLRPPVNALVEGLHTEAQSLESPEPPAFYTPRFNTNAERQRSPPAQSSADPESPDRLPTTPEAPVFQTPYLNRMATSRKNARQPQPINMDANGDDASDLPSPRNVAPGSKRLWESDVPGVSATGAEDGQMPEMPILESILGNSLQTRSSKMQKTVGNKKGTEESSVCGPELDGPTQEFSFGTPRLRTDYQEPGIPEMDLSCVTQDICKLLNKAPSKRPATAVVHPNVRLGNDPIRAVRLPEVSESEFQSLPKYLKQMTLLSLNQAVSNINRFTEESRGGQTEFRMEELRRMCVAGIKTPVYILCLTELKRLEHAGGAQSAAVYKLCTRT
ncbi:spindle and kinetochore-associated protein 3 [Clinocottus analis]|uniref:spindle and kinetochore-associated protein 3 n=1 Tax=Clinocottus analis TaxID=304258 RepID=UPI0035BFB668